MKRFTRSLVLGLSLVVASAVYAGSPTYRIQVDGLACPFCAYGLEKRLRKIDGVKEIKTDISAGAVTVKMEEGKTLGKEQARKAVKKAGFTLGGFEEITPREEGSRDGRAKE